MGRAEHYNLLATSFMLLSVILKGTPTNRKVGYKSLVNNLNNQVYIIVIIQLIISTPQYKSLCAFPTNQCTHF